jgi:microcystin degradation protein MlrC
MIRLAVAGMHHETNTFSSIPADLPAYQDGGIRRGAEMTEYYRGSEATLGGFLSPVAEGGEGTGGTDTGGTDETVELVPLLDAMVNPCGPVSAAAYSAIVDEMADALQRALPVDGLLLCLHGACVADGHPSADADIAERMRAIVGPDTPVGCVVDMHANLDPRLADLVDVLVGYQTNPHVDPADRARKCRSLVIRAARTGWRPATAVEQLPLVVTIARQDTSQAPMADLLVAARAAETRPGVVDVSLLEGFPYADVPQMGMSVIATHESSVDAARAVAAEVAAAVWARREDLQGGTVPVATAVAEISGHRGARPLLVLDVGDNVGGGGPGDSTVLLEALVAAGVGSVATTLNDPDAVGLLADAAVGTAVTVTLGGRSPEQDGRPVPVSGRVVGRHEGLFSAPTVSHGGFRHFDGGTMVGIVTDADHHIVVTSRAVQPVTPAQFTAVGIDPTAVRAIVAKGVNGPRAGYADLCGGLVVVDTPGVTRSSVDRFDYRHRRRPMYPYEPETGYPGPAIPGGAA